LCRSFILQSIKTWKLLKLAANLGQRISEETITDINMLELQSKHRRTLVVRKYSKQIEEPIEGADWEMWFASRGNVLGFRMQAKILSGYEYPGIDYVIKSTRKRQMDLLIERAFASTPRRIPFYVFYNHWTSLPFAGSELCGTYPPDEEMLGCGLAYANHVRQIVDVHKSKSLKEIQQIMYPWNCLVCCRAKSNGALPLRSFEFAKEMVVQRFQDKFPSEPLSEDMYVTDHPPDYVMRVLDGGTLIDDEWRELNLKMIMVAREDHRSQESSDQ
jgi:hypothetical protein